MRKLRTLVGLMVIALGASARAQEPAPAPAPAPLPDAAPAAAPPPAVTVTTVPAPAADESRRPLEISLSFLPMGRGKLTTPGGAANLSGDAQFAYGGALSVTYRVVAGLHLGLAPQAIYNVNYKTNPAGNGIPLPASSTEYDLMARIQYAVPIIDGITLYAEALPGYSLIIVPHAKTPAGPVLALGGGAAMDMSDRIFINVGVGYQLGFQSLSLAGTAREDRTRYVRVALGVGARF
ncbi:MAG TPA: hypothetical protein VKZ18_28250 [Polyangia bacterium]|nr:hypothetical protein [Polyangia bacterium]